MHAHYLEGGIPKLDMLDDIALYIDKRIPQSYLKWHRNLDIGPSEVIADHYSHGLTYHFEEKNENEVGYVNAKELAKITGLHFNTVYKMIREGEIVATRDEKSYKIPRSEVDRLKKDIGSKDNSYIKELLEENSKLKNEIKRIKETLKSLI